MLNGRTLSLTARNLIMPGNYAALGRAAQVYERPLPALNRYVLGHGTYPCAVRLRTSLGPQTVTLFSSSDAVTVHEIFCRRDYWFPGPPPEVVVDIGSNIGVSALYFLTRSPSAYCHLYEPDPRNVGKLQANLAPFRDRYTLHETAVAGTEGVLPFSREATGRYGSLNRSPVHCEADAITVQVEHVNTALDRALSRARTVDLLKIDSEGSERATIRAIDPQLRERIRHIVIESRDHRVTLDGFRAELHCDTLRFTSQKLSS